MLTHFLPAFFLVFLLHPLPLCQNVLYIHLASELLLYSNLLRQHHPDLPIRLLPKHIRQFPGRPGFRPRHFLPHLLHGRRRQIILPLIFFILCLPQHTSLCILFLLGFLLRLISPFLGSRFPADRFLPKIRRQQFVFSTFRRIGPLLPYIRSFRKTGPLYFQLRLFYVAGFSEKYFRFFRLHVIINSFSCRLLMTGVPSPQHFLKPCGKLLLEIDGIILANIHGFHLNVHLLRHRLSICLFPRCLLCLIVILPKRQRLFLHLPIHILLFILLMLCVFHIRFRLFRIRFGLFYCIFIKTMIINVLLIRS